MVAVLAMAFSMVIPTNAQTQMKKFDNVDYEISESANGIYIVQMFNKPVVVYEGDIQGYKATKPAKGKKINPNSSDVVNYAAYLDRTHDTILAKVGGKKVYDYRYAFNGFAAELTVAQANKMTSFDGVVAVSADTLYTMDTSSTPTFLGLNAEGGLWGQLGGVDSAGEDIIIGIVDSGIWPESLSFSDRTGVNGNGNNDGKLSYYQIPGWHGKCTPGEDFPASDCNRKLIGAQYFNASWGGDAGIEAQRPWEFTSPRDYNGHGTHTASTAGGNFGVEVIGPAAVFGTISGIAPRARIASYKALWSTEDGSTASGFTGDLVAAIDQAVADGVDVINYSISGTRTVFMDPAEIAFLFAADAGVFVAASAGNSGPDASTVAHPSPWITTVAASTHDRYYEACVTLGNNGDTYYGASVNTTGAGPADLVYAADVCLAGADPEEAKLCYPGTLDPDLVNGKIVLCDRGTIARVSKSYAVYIADGIGTILANTCPSSLNGDLHSVPTVHVDDVDGAAIRDYFITDAAPTAEIFPSYTAPVSAPVIASFSSRGPLLAGSGDILKPDISAPGVDILAAVAPPGNGGKDFDLYSGTSMSSPHVAGLAALLKDLHPDWSPMMVKSALMTTGFDLLSGADPFAQGAGHVAPNSAADPGLVYNSGWVDWLGFLCGTGELQASYCSSIGIDPSNLNLASIAIGALPGAQTVERTVTNVGDKNETYYTFSYSLPGVDVVANPAFFSVAPGQTESYELTFTVNGAALNAYTSGFVTWTGDEGHIVRSPVAVRPVQLAVPAEVAGAGSDGSLSFDVTFGYTGDYTVAAHGLVAAEMQTGNVVDDSADDINVALDTGVGITMHVVNIPENTAYARFSLFDAYTDGNDDLDLYIFDAAWNYMGGSGSGTSAEQVNIYSPVPGNYYVIVHGWGTDGPDANYTLFGWAVPAATGSSNMTISGAPTSATQGSTATLTVNWLGLDDSPRYLGAISHSDAGGLLDMTLIGVDTD
jgi:subtilisin family serine protease